MPADPISTLRSHGRLTGGELAKRLDVSRATLMRAVRAAGDAVVSLGNARRTTYAARRPLRGSWAPLPLYRVDQAGQPHEIARLHPTHPAGCAVEYLGDFGWPLDGEMAEGWFGGLPYPVYDMRPQGFLGRQFAHRCAALLQVDANPERWSDDDVLHVLSLLGSDAPGDLILGEAACTRWLEEAQRARVGEWPDAIVDADLPVAYPRLATEAMAAGVAGSSAGGEFPKFPALRLSADGEPCHVLVKFSGNDGSPGTTRWADLLVCEHLAGVVLREELGLTTARSRILQHDGRTFLEVERFDRHGALGRSGMVSWLSLNAALFGGASRPWTEAGRQLAECDWLSAEDAHAVERQWHFGLLIGNTDMHDGNLSFVPAAGAGTARLAPTPVYDMLPMLYAPLRGVELPERRYAPPLPLPAHEAAWRDAAHAALRYWQRAAADERISRDFRARCDANASQLAHLLG